MRGADLGLLGGAYAAFAIVSAIRQAVACERGTHIDCSMLGATLGVAALQTSKYFGNEHPAEVLAEPGALT